MLYSQPDTVGNTPNIVFSGNVPDSLDEYQQLGTDFLTAHSDIQITVLLGTHSLAEDLGPPGIFERMVHQSDIYAPEGTSSPLFEFYVNRMAEGVKPHKKIVAEFERSTHGKRIGKAIFNSHTHIFFCDVELNSPVTLKYWGSEDGYDKAKEAVENNTRTSAELKAFWARFLPYQDEREWHMIGNLGSSIEDLAAVDSEVRKKLEMGALRVLFTLGSYHVMFAKKLASLGLEPMQILVEDLLSENIEDATAPGGS